jgi:hypothetical protein
LLPPPLPSHSSHCQSPSWIHLHIYWPLLFFARLVSYKLILWHYDSDEAT